MAKYTEVRLKNNQFILVTEGEEDIEVTNFVSQLQKDITYKLASGISTHEYLVRVKKQNGDELESKIIPSPEFDRMQWASRHWGSEAFVHEKAIFKNQVRKKMLLREGIKKETRYQNVGFIKQNGKPLTYVDNGGCFTKDGYDDSIKSCLQDKLSKYELSPPIDDVDEIEECILAMLNIGELSPNNPFVGLLCQTTVIKALMSIFLPNTCTHFLVGETGSMKSSVATVIQSFHGQNFESSLDLPESWNSTKAALENTLTMIKHSVLVIDDFVPNAKTNKELSNKAEDILRASANRAKKTLANNAGGIRQGSTPDATILITGEALSKDLVTSLLMRVMFFPITKGDIDTDSMDEYQDFGKEGVLAMFTSLFIMYLLEKQDKLSTSIPRIFKQYRTKASKELIDKHSRCFENAASLMVAQSLLFSFAKWHKVISKGKPKKMLEDSWHQILQLVKRQTQITEEHSLPNVVFKYFKKGMSEGYIHLVDHSTGDEPEGEDTIKFGWENEEPKGHCVGWFNEKTQSVYIETSETTFKVLYNLFPEGFKDAMPDSHKSFWKTMNESGGLSETEKERNTVRKTVFDFSEGASKSIPVYFLSFNFELKK